MTIYKINRQPVRIKFGFPYTSRTINGVTNNFFALYDALTKAAAQHCWTTEDNGSPDTFTWIIKLNYGDKTRRQFIAQSQLPWETTNPDLTGIKELFTAMEMGLAPGLNLEIDKYQAYFQIMDESAITPVVLPDSLMIIPPEVEPEEGEEVEPETRQMTWAEWLADKSLSIVEREIDGQNVKLAPAKYHNDSRPNDLRDIECSILYQVEKDDNVVRIVPECEVPEAVE